jgi:hypothetical protein
MTIYCRQTVLIALALAALALCDGARLGARKQEADHEVKRYSRDTRDSIVRWINRCFLTMVSRFNSHYHRTMFSDFVTRLKATIISSIIEKHFRVVPTKGFSISASLQITMDMKPHLNGWHWEESLPLVLPEEKSLLITLRIPISTASKLENSINWRLWIARVTDL